MLFWSCWDVGGFDDRVTWVFGLLGYWVIDWLDEYMIWSIGPLHALVIGLLGV